MSIEPIVIRRPSIVEDPYGDPIEGEYADAGEYLGRFAPNNPAEPVEVGRNAVITGGTVYLRDLSVAPDIASSDRARVRGVEYEIDGEVGLWRRNSGFAVQFAVKKVRDER